MLNTIALIWQSIQQALGMVNRVTNSADQVLQVVEKNAVIFNQSESLRLDKELAELQSELSS